MRFLKIAPSIVLAFILMLSCKKKEVANEEGKYPIDSTKFAAFFQKHPNFKEYEKDIKTLYRKYQYKYIWYDEEGRNEFSDVLYNRARQIGAEGVPVPLPYKEEYAELFDRDSEKPILENDLLISAMYFFYAKKVYAGLDPNSSKKTGWFLPRERVGLVSYLDELMKDPDKLKKDEDENPTVYYNLRKGLQRYREISKKGGWGTISLPAGVKSLKEGDNSPAVAQLRKRLAITAEFGGDPASTVFDSSLTDAVKSWQTRNGLNPDGIVGNEMITSLNVPVDQRILTIIVNMERCRWLPDRIDELDEYIGVNIPAYSMHYVKDGETALQSRVIVGEEATKTVVFSGKMSYLVFSPYWNVPESIKEKEILPALEEDPDYLVRNNMEWDGERIRQKPSDENSLGRVKFMFPNSNNIYLHDTPAKSLFRKEDRALSHGCVRVQKARDLAIMILEDDKNWSRQKIDAAMRADTEQQYALKRKIPVYIAYFTAVADENGNVAFFEDIYKRDNRLAHLLYSDKT